MSAVSPSSPSCEPSKPGRDPTFDEKDDLLRLFAASGMLVVDREKLHAQQWTDAKIEAHLRSLRVAGNEVFKVWANNYRFASEERLRVHLKKTTGYKRIKGDYLKEQARRFLISAQRFVNEGIVQWQA
jgi:hypothetical protein